MNKLKMIPILILCGLFVIISLPAQAQMMGNMQGHMGMMTGVQKMLEGSNMLKMIFKMLDDKAISMEIAEPFLREANRLIQEGVVEINKTKSQMSEQRKEMKKNREPRHLKMKDMKMYDHKMMQPEDKTIKDDTTKKEVK